MQFKLLFEPSLIAELAGRYSFQDDLEPLDAGKKIAAGDYSRKNLERIFEWKTNGRGRSRLQKNDDQEIADALRLAVEAKTDRSAVAVLTGLNGVQVPVASAILTALDPSRFTIIDFRALEALDVKQPYISIDFYLMYVSECRRLANMYKVPLRTLDRALWQWSKELDRS